MEVINALCGARETFVMLPVFFDPAGSRSAFDVFSCNADEFPVPAVLETGAVLTIVVFDYFSGGANADSALNCAGTTELETDYRAYAKVQGKGVHCVNNPVRDVQTDLVNNAVSPRTEPCYQDKSECEQQ